MSRSVLIVEDEASIAIALEFLLRKQGYRLRRVEDGEAALEAVAAETPDLILLDVMLPKRSGFDVCQTIRADRALDAVRIALMTAKGGRNERAKGEAVGADAYIVKPFSNSELIAEVKALLGKDREANRPPDG